MWVMLNNSFVSIVEHRDSPELLIVRGRFAGDVERFLGVPVGHCVVQLTPMADYAYRALVAREVVERAMLRAVRRVCYPNFKASIGTLWRQEIAMRVWSIFATEQWRRLK